MFVLFAEKAGFPTPTLVRNGTRHAETITHSDWKDWEKLSMVNS